MKILAIRGKNLASLAGDFAVDFEQEPLRSAGLFAICGPTGAGKSTLLDALCMALYENTPRLLKAGGNKTLPDGSDFITHQDAANLLRRGCAEGHAEVDFTGNDGAHYRARWSVRRSRGKVGGSLQPTGMSLKRLPELQPIGGTKAEVKAEIVQRIGLSFQQFTRAVLLAQNEFSSFLKADDSERGELLETLTGSAIYSQLSQRAFARARTERELLERINERLADQRPLTDEDRDRLEQDSSAASAIVATLDLRKTLLEARLRWHQDDHKFQQNEQLARQEWQQRQSGQAAVASRRADLQRLDSVQSARPLAAEIERLTRAIAQDDAAIADCQTRLASAALTTRKTDAALELARHALQAAEQAQAKAAPVLDQAKALDARIDTLLPAQRQARQAQTDADQAAALAQRQKQARQDELAAASLRQQASELWLAQHAPLHTLSEDWPRWDLLLKQSAQSLQETTRAQARLTTLAQDQAAQSDLLQTGTAAFSAVAIVLSDADRQRQQALLHHASIDSAALQAAKTSADTRREHLNSAAQIWRALADQRSRKQVLEAQSATAKQAAASAGAARDQASNQIPPLNAALAQAERSLKSAEAACADSVETLRAALEDDSPCPVCGATAHPYTQDNPRLHALLASLQAEVARCRQQTQDMQKQHASHSADAISYQRQADELAQEQQQLHVTLGRHSQDWQAHPLAGELAPLAAFDAAWFASQQSAVQARLDSIAISDAAWRRSTQAKDAAQAAFDRAAQDHSRKKDSVSAAQAALTVTQSRESAAAGQHDQSQQRLTASLDQLDAAFSAADEAGHWQSGEQIGWRSNWQAAPDNFHAQCEQSVRQWQTRHNAREQGRERCAVLTLELSGRSEVHSQAEAARQQAASAFASCDTALKAMQAGRQALFGGQPVQQTEAQLAHAIAAARTLLEQHTQQRDDSKLAQSRSAEALQLAQDQRIAHNSEAEAAAGQLTSWLSRYNAAAGSAGNGDPADEDDPTTGNPLDSARLQNLLGHPAGEIAAGHKQLQAIDGAVRQADTVLQERIKRRQEHQLQRPPADDVTTGVQTQPEAATNQAETPVNPLTALQQALQTLSAERQTAQAQATGYQIALAQDQSRRINAADLLAGIALQAATTRLWGQLNELIGAADGKKFRNYAQQITLDVLLGYANRHLHELSRRYRLQRISETLALMVVDQDMGDELRSVHSLSGGESFLVSLALALGLASLSSNRVQVESLFIDEGFGSLDAETLRVAMDALDGLQSMGRKVGVISHVQEMTERIATKILVQRTAGGRSLVGVG